MDRGEFLKLFGLMLLAGLLILVAQYNLLGILIDPWRRAEFLAQAVPAVQGFVRTWWLAFVLAALIAIAIPVFRAAQAKRHQTDINARVAGGPLVQLLPRADWKPVDPDDVQVWVRLADALPHDEHISFETGGGESGLSFALRGSAEGVRAALTQFKAEWPGLFHKPNNESVPPEWAVWWVELAPAAIERAVQAASTDPLRAILIEINGVQGHGRGLVQVIARRNFGARKTLGEKAFAARDVQTQSKGVRALRTQEAKELEERARATYLDVTVRAVGLADTPERAQGIARGLARAISASFDGNNPVQPVRQGNDPQIVARREPGRMAPWSANDLAFLAHLPGRDLMQLAPRLATAPARYLPADSEMRFDAARYRTAFLMEEKK